MKKVFGFIAGMLSGSMVGAAVALLMTPASGEQLREQARSRWEEAMSEAKRAMEETEQQKSLEFEVMKQSGRIR